MRFCIALFALLALIGCNDREVSYASVQITDRMAQDTSGLYDIPAANLEQNRRLIREMQLERELRNARRERRLPSAYDPAAEPTHFYRDIARVYDIPSRSARKLVQALIGLSVGDMHELQHLGLSRESITRAYRSGGQMTAQDLDSLGGHLGLSRSKTAQLIQQIYTR